MKALLRSIVCATAVTLTLLGCSTSDATRRDYLESLAAQVAAPVRPVIVIPGFGNSKLLDPETGIHVWGTARAMMHTRFPDDLDLPIDAATGTFGPDRLEPVGFAGGRAWINISWHLARALRLYGGYADAEAVPPPESLGTVYRFAYDWRLSALDNTRRLDAMIERVRERHRDADLQVDIVAHSAGAFIATAYAKLGTASIDEPEQWEASSRAAAAKVHSMILISTPFEGTVEAFRILARGEKLVRREIPHETAASFLSVTELLPSDGIFLMNERGEVIREDLLHVDGWKRRRLSIFRPDSPASEELKAAFERSLERASRVRAALDRPFPATIPVTAIAGDCVPTARYVLTRGDGTFAFYRDELRPEEEPLVRRMFMPGDGSVTLRSATALVAEKSQSTIFCDGHQGIVSDPHVLRAVLRALQTETAATVGSPPR